ncbi:transcriptional adapter 2-alpha-like isoform X1 [Anthonomus grandis grandis]|uniref:transcriptional adapter 2-alpha-like isoform X1 n=1 Tax=Anthonomus grandis grandis TaxID=2921223 RepID=UPI002165C032|nr:transcriptional adapter 2-alpha-like isoform X1 [Anthonomus grandis grandis]
MANTNTDLTEEDAADLQFPKETQRPKQTVVTLNKNTDGKSVVLGHCSHCFYELIKCYIFCDRCKINICLECFANGAEFLNHKNNHEYQVLTTNFQLFENSDWMAEEELRLLDLLLFYGNWDLVALDFPNRTVDEIKEHYEYFYLDRHGNGDIPIFKNEPVLSELIVPYRFQLADSEEPPRYAANTIGYQSLAGYNPPRGDFENDYDKNAEDLVASLDTIDPDDPSYEIQTNLQYAIMLSYNNRLKERQRRKDVIAAHGLIVLRKTLAWLHRYNTTLTPAVCKKFLRFMHLCEPMKFEMLLEGMHRAGELRILIQRLICLRKNGITTLSEGRMYVQMQELREDYKKRLKLFRSKPQYSFKHKNTTTNMQKQKKKITATPLDIVGLPGYDNLTDKEKEMCSNVRLVPAIYLELKDILIAENQRAGRVNLKKARTLLKIDVNKTRKLFDFMVSEAYIRI